MASQAETITKVHKIKKILQINLETEEEYYEVQNESVDLIEFLEDETNKSHKEVEKNNANEIHFLEKTLSLSKPTPMRTHQPNSGQSFLDETESWSQSFCIETPEPASLDNSGTSAFFQNKTQSLNRSHSNETPCLSPVSGLLDDTLTLSGNKTASSYSVSIPTRSEPPVASCSESFNNNACPKSPILECSRSSPPPEAHTTECRPSTSRDLQNVSLDNSGSRELNLSSNHGSLDAKTKMLSQEMSLAPVYERGDMSSQVGQIIDHEKFASCPICYKILFKEDLLVHASGCEGEEDGFVGMSSGFLCGYCTIHIKDRDEEMGEHLFMCKAVMAMKRAEAERQGRKKTLRKVSIQRPDKRSGKSKEAKTNLKRSAALVCEIQPIHKQKKCDPSTSNATRTDPPASNATSINPPATSSFFPNPYGYSPSISKEIGSKPPETSGPVKRNIRGNSCLHENIRIDNSISMNQQTGRRNTSVRNLTASRANGKAKKKAHVIPSACPLCFKHWMMEDLEVHASECLGEEEIILDGTETERFWCGYCSMFIQVGEDEKKNHLISCRKKMVMEKWQEAAREKKNVLRSRKKKEVIEEESLSSDHELEIFPSKQSSVTLKKIPAVKKCSVIVKKWKIPIKECGVFFKNCQTANTPFREDLDSEQLREGNASSVSELEKDTNEEVIARWRKRVAVAIKDTVAPKTVKTATKKPTIELPISMDNNKKKIKLFSLTPQQSEIFNPVEVKFKEVDPHNVVMAQLKERRPNRK